MNSPLRIPRRTAARAATWVLVVFAIAALVGTIGVSTAPGLGSASVLPAPTLSPAATGFPTPIQHVITIFMENKERSTVLNQGPFQVSLQNQYAYSSTYYAPCHHSAPEYLAATSGQTLQCGSDALNSYSVNNIGNMLDTAGIPWKSYQESMPTPCDKSNSGNYAYRHNPFIYYSDLGSNCAANDVPFTNWNPNATSQPAYIWVTPNVLDDAHNTNTSYGDAWLKVFFDGGSYTSSSDLHGWKGILNEPWFSSTVVFVTYDEGSTSAGYSVPGVSNSYCTNGLSVCGGNIYFSAVSPYSSGVGLVSGDATHYNLLATEEWLLGLPCTGGGLDCNSGFPAMTGLFHFTSTGSSSFSVRGSVVDPNGTGLSAATVYANGSTDSTAKTGSTGSFSFTLANGTYAITATDPGYQRGYANVTVRGANITGLTVTLTPLNSSGSTFSVGGTVSDSSNGTGLSGAAVYANGSSSSISTTSGTGGAFGFHLRNGTYRITATAAGYLPAATNVTVHGAAVSGLVLALAPSGGPSSNYTVEGRVTSAVNGANVSGATVYANTSSTSISSTSAANGTYLLALPNGNYSLTAIAAGFLPSSRNLTVAGGPQSGVDLALPPAAVGSGAYTLSGTVTNGTSGLPVPGVTVYANASGTSQVTAAAANGTFGFLVANGSYELTATGAGYVPSSINVSVAGANLEGVNLSLAPNGTLPTDGVVTNAVDGTPVGNATLTFENGTTVVQVRTNGTGGYAVQLPPGDYLVSVQATGFSVTTSLVSMHARAGADYNFALAPALSAGPGNGGGSMLPVGAVLVVAIVAGIAGVLAPGILRRGFFHRGLFRRRPPRSR